MNRRSSLHALSGAGIFFLAGRLRPAWAQAGKIKPGASSALIVVDVQNCFVAGGTLAVKDGDAVVHVINAIAPAFENVILTQD